MAGNLTTAGHFKKEMNKFHFRQIKEENAVDWRALFIKQGERIKRSIIGLTFKRDEWVMWEVLQMPFIIF
jgi:hypothetical protein